MTRSYKTNKQNKPKEMTLKADKDALVEFKRSLPVI